MEWLRKAEAFLDGVDQTAAKTASQLTPIKETVAALTTEAIPTTETLSSSTLSITPRATFEFAPEDVPPAPIVLPEDAAIETQPSATQAAAPVVIPLPVVSTSAPQPTTPSVAVQPSVQLKELEQHYQKQLKQQQEQFQQQLLRQERQLQQQKQLLHQGQESQQQFQQQLQQLQERLQTLQQREATLQSDNAQTAVVLAGATRRAEDSERQVAQLKAEVQRVQRELTDYRARAAAALSAKPRDDARPASATDGLAEAYESLRKDYQMAIRQMEDLRLERDEAVRSSDEWRQESVNIADAGRSELAQLQKQLSTVTAAKKALQDDLELLNRKLVSTKESHALVAQSLNQHLSAKDAEIQRLQGTIAARRDDTDTKMREMSEQMMLKQTMVESLQSEKRALQLQLDGVLMGREALPDIVVATHEDLGPEGNAEQTGGRVFDNLAQGGVLQQAVAKLASAADAGSLKAGFFLRRYPIMRVALVFYALLLHMWVFYILLGHMPSHT
eukprot:TRINITY_DN15653_c0_g1_i1.p1 TRINITY_DN15653_c0_g1~~TRINITY_DN15653_c0_g1_i1.p1  ORF type:complete len:502 (+),score=151.24 TRINITY_DN15653_c0_g1_i1:31-1536(+)